MKAMIKKKAGIAAGNGNPEVDIRISNLYKQFSVSKEKNNTLMQKILSFMRISRHQQGFYALQNINIEIKPGEFIGLIGDNGSGKTTLLRIIAKVMVPTKGDVISNRRIVPVLNLGVGFEEEFTGRENIRLYGVILGIDKRELEHNMPSIIKFAGVEKFIDTPLKKFSAGNKTRLAFSTCIHANPDIILLDEITAVGDKGFQEKCFREFEKLRAAKKTIILSSHDLSVISRFCNKTLYLKDGKQVMFDSTSKVLEQYAKDCAAKDRKNRRILL